MRRGRKAIDWEQAGSCNALDHSALVAAHPYSMVINGTLVERETLWCEGEARQLTGSRQAVAMH